MSATSSRRWVLPLAAAGGLVAIGLLLRSSGTSGPAPAASASASASAGAAAEEDAELPPISGRTGRAAVVVYDEGQPLPNRPVVFHESDGRVVASTKSGADGKASAEIHSNGMVTVAYGTSVRRLVTITGVEPGDEVLVGEKDDDEAAAGDSVAKAKVKLPGPHPNAKRYGVSLGVGLTDVADPNVPTSMPVLRRYLVDKKKFAVLGLAFEGEGDPVAYAFDWGKLGDQDGGDVAMSLPAWSKAWREHRFVLAKAPRGAEAIDAALGIVSGEDRFECGRRKTTLAADADTTLRFAVPKPLGETAQVRLEIAFGASTDRALFSKRLKTIPTETRLDLGAVLLPRVSNAKVERKTDVARPIVRWESAADASKAKAVFVQLTWPETKEHVWTIVAPASTMPNVRVPSLPASLAEWRPDARPIAPAIGLVEASEYETYDDVRKKGIHLVGEPPEDDDAIVVISATGGDLVF